ncbi:MAG: HAMP domain-containing histidine kinase [Holophagales bacterium]|nr:MAG: HAMP domain-containing histidine kinase [Holophagales bacterium]
MRRRGGAFRPVVGSLAIGVGLLGALVAVAVLQYRWIAQLSAAERERMRTSLETGTALLADDFDRELVRASTALQPAAGIDDVDLAGDLAERLARWRTSAPEPRLVRELVVVSHAGRGEQHLSHLDEATGHLVPTDWSPELESARRIFLARGRIPILDERLPGLILPVRDLPEGGEREPGGPAPRRPPRHHILVRLDREWLTEELLPRLVAARLGGASSPAYAVTITLADDPAEQIFRARPALVDRSFGKPDAARRLFALRPFPELTAPPGGRRPPGRESTEPAPPARFDRDGTADRARRDDREGPEVGRWRLEVRHVEGSLEAAVKHAQRRNLGLGLLVLLLLLTTTGLLVASTRHAQRLAQQQMDFVAAVSHELKTPLTAMRSAGQNLADGIVDEPEKVRRYGALIEKEGRRLTEMVGRVLTFAGIRSGSLAYRIQPLAARELVDGVLADCRWVLEDRRVEVDVPDTLPPLLGDPTALRQALANLIDNALKYGGASRWIGVRARGGGGGSSSSEITLAVSDRGLGIRKADLPRVFEPFFRGGEATKAGIGGSGLGLAVVRGIVEAHGGRVTVESATGEGTTVSLHLPAAPAAEVRA